MANAQQSGRVDMDRRIIDYNRYSMLINNRVFCVSVRAGDGPPSRLWPGESMMQRRRRRRRQRRRSRSQVNVIAECDSGV